MTQIICYTYNAACHCIECAESIGYDKNHAKDSEGNPVGVVFNTDSDFHNTYSWGGLECDSCFDEIIENEAGRYEDESDIHAEFMAHILPLIKSHYEQDGVPDKPARREGFNNWLDSLEIGESIKSVISHPPNLEDE